MRLIIPFSSIFMKQITYVKEGMFMSAWASPTQKLAMDHYSKLKDLFKVGVEMFNELYPEMPLLTKKDMKDLEQNVNSYSLVRQTLSGVVQPWSKFYVLSTDKRSTNPGLMCSPLL